jgi:hypothetical protein
MTDTDVTQKESQAQRFNNCPICGNEAPKEERGRTVFLFNCGRSNLAVCLEHRRYNTRSCRSPLGCSVLAGKARWRIDGEALSSWRCENASIWLEYAKQVTRYCGARFDEARFRNTLILDWGPYFNEEILRSASATLQQLDTVAAYLRYFHDFDEAIYRSKVEEIVGQSLYVWHERQAKLFELLGVTQQPELNYELAEKLMTGDNREKIQAYLSDLLQSSGVPKDLEEIAEERRTRLYGRQGR